MYKVCVCSQLDFFIAGEMRISESYCSPMHSVAAVFTVNCFVVERSFVLSPCNGSLSGHPDLHL